MKKLFSAIMCLMLICLPAMAEGTGALVVDSDNGCMLLADNGDVIIGDGIYDVIMCVTEGECAPESRLYSAANFTVSVGGFTDPGDGDPETWPDEEGGLDGDVSIDGKEDWGIAEVEDMPLDGGVANAGDFEGDEYYDDYFDVMYALMNAKGELLTDFSYVSFSHDPVNKLVYATRADYFVSVLDENGKALVEGNYAQIVTDGVGGFFAAKPDLEAIDEYGNFPDMSALCKVSADGAETDTGMIVNTYDILPGFASGYMCLYIYNGNEDAEGGYVYIDASGATVFGGSFSYAANFDGDYAAVEDESFVARIIDKTGAFVTDADYSYFDYGTSGDGMPIIANYTSGGFDLLSKADLSLLAHFDLPDNCEQMYAYQSGDRFIAAYCDMGMMIIDENANVVYEGGIDDSVYTWYNECDAKPERLVKCVGTWPEAKYSIIDSEGANHSGEYQEISAMSWLGGKGRYLVASYDVVENEYDGEKITEADYDTYLYGVIDQEGNTVIETKYTNLTYLSGDRYWVSDSAAYYLMDSDGNTIATFPVAEEQ